jgi:hypothetical protein
MSERLSDVAHLLRLSDVAHLLRLSELSDVAHLLRLSDVAHLLLASLLLSLTAMHFWRSGAEPCFLNSPTIKS